MAGVSACGRIKVISSPSCGLTPPKTWVYSRTRWVDTCGRQPKGAQQPIGSLMRPKRASSSNISRKGRLGCPAATAATLAGSFFKSRAGLGVVLGMFGPGLHPPPLVAGQQSIHRGRRHGMAQFAFIAPLEAPHRDQPPSLSFLFQRCQDRLLPGYGQILMATTTLGPSLATRQSGPQIIRPNATDVTDA